MMYGVILAGGTGERFWPLSRRENPKQFLPLFGQRTMLQLTMDKLKGLITAQNVFVVTDKAYEDLVAAQLPELPLENIICEPCGRDTAAAVGLAAEHIAHRDPQGIMVVLPADHYIADVEEFRRVLKAGVEVAREGGMGTNYRNQAFASGDRIRIHTTGRAARREAGNSYF